MKSADALDAGNRPGALGVGFLQALRALLIGFIPIALVTLIAWAAGGSGNGKSADAIHGAGWIWLAAHHVGFALRLPPGGVPGRLWLLPLGLSIIPWFVLRDSGRRIGASVIAAERRFALAAFVVTYALSLLAASELLATRAVTPDIWVSLGSGFIAALVFGSVGAYGMKNLWQPISVRLPNLVKSLLRGVAVTSLVFYGASSLVLLVALGSHWSEFSSLFTVLDLGWIGLVLLILIVLATFPNAVVMTACLATGAGFAVGNGTLISPLRVQTGQLPAFPLLAPLPTGRSMFLTLLPIVAVVASAIGGFVAARVETRLWPKLRGSVLHALLNVAVLLVLNALAGGPLLGGQLSDIGASYLRILSYAPPVFIVGSALGALVSLFAGVPEDSISER